MKNSNPKKRTPTTTFAVRKPSDILNERRESIRQLSKWLDSLAKNDPGWAAVYATQVLEIGTGVLLKLIETKELLSTEGFCDDAEARLCGYFERLSREISWLVKKGRETPVSGAWGGAKELAKALHDLALAAGPGDEGLFTLQKIASRSLYMPSLRANVKKFDYDFGVVAKKIGLARQCTTNSGWSRTPIGFKLEESKSKYDLNSSATQFVVEFVEHVSRLQRITREREAWLESRKTPGPNMPRFRKCLRWSVRKSLRREYSKEQVSELMAYHDLPRFGCNSRQEFWELVLKPHLEKPETLAQLQGTALHRELEEATDAKPYQMRDILKKRCKQALQSKTLVKESDFP